MMSNQRGVYGLVDHFVYIAGATGPPSLSLLPASNFMMQEGNTGILRRGENDLRVVHIQVKYDRDARRDMAQFCVLCHGTSEWELNEPVPIVDDEAGEGYKSRRSGKSVIPIGDRFLC